MAILRPRVIGHPGVRYLGAEHAIRGSGFQGFGSPALMGESDGNRTMPGWALTVWAGRRAMGSPIVVIAILQTDAHKEEAP